MMEIFSTHRNDCLHDFTGSDEARPATVVAGFRLYQ